MADEEEVRDPTPGDINSRLLERLVDSDTVAAKRLEPMACIAVGFPKGKTATFDGTGGDNFGGLNRGAQLILNGGAGRLAGNSMLAGEIIVNGSAGSGAGHGLAGGTLVVQGSVRGSAAAGMLDGELLVAGDVDGSLGTGMQGGTVAVAGDVSGDVARYMAGGKLFIAGNFTPPEAGAKPAAPSERKIVQKLLQEHGIDPHGLEFQSVSGTTVARPPELEREELPELLSRLRLVEAVLKRRPRRPGLDPVNPGLTLGPDTGEPLNLTIPLLWQGEHAPQMATWEVGGRPPEFGREAAAAARHGAFGRPGECGRASTPGYTQSSAGAGASAGRRPERRHGCTERDGARRRYPCAGRRTDGGGALRGTRQRAAGSGRDAPGIGERRAQAAGARRCRSHADRQGHS